MTAYLVITARIHDRAAFLSGYAPAAAALVDRMGGHYVARGPAEALEGADPGLSVVLSRWPDREAALAFWHSPDYARIRTLRNGIADCTVLLV